MVVNYYSTDYSDAAQTGLTVALNRTLAAAAAVNAPWSPTHGQDREGCLPYGASRGRLNSP